MRLPFCLIHLRLHISVSAGKLMSKSLHTLGLIACGMKIAMGTAYYLSVEIMKETCVPKDGAKKDKCDADYTRWSNSFFMGSLLFFGMSFTLIPYFVSRHGKPGATPVNKQTLVNMLLPALLEFVGQVMYVLTLLCPSNLL